MPYAQGSGGAAGHTWMSSLLVPSAWPQIREAQNELAARLGPDKLAFLQKRAASKRSAAASASGTDGTPYPQPRGVSAVGKYTPGGTAGRASDGVQPAAVPGLSDQRCEAGPPDISKLVQNRGGQGAQLCLLGPSNKVYCSREGRILLKVSPAMLCEAVSTDRVPGALWHGELLPDHAT